MSYSQNDEEETIVAYFEGRYGRFLDIGAYDFFALSNTRRLAELGWSGVLVEADPVSFAALVRNNYFPKVASVCAAIMLEAGLLPFSIVGGAVSTSDAASKSRWPGVPFTEIYVASITVKDLLDRFSGPYEFVSLDIEGNNLAILERLPIAKMGVQAICVEHDGKRERVREICRAAGLTRELLDNPENLILAK